MSLVAFLPIIGQVIDKVFPDKEKAAEAKLKLAELEQAGQLAELNAELQVVLGQLEVNKAEAQHPSVFVAGGRPAIIWICGAGLAMAYPLREAVMWLAWLAGKDMATFPISTGGELIPLLVGLLGIGFMRSYDKRFGSATTRVQ